MKYPKFLLVLITLLVVSACSETPIILETPQETDSSNEQVVQPTIDPTQESTELDPTQESTEHDPPERSSELDPGPDTHSPRPKMAFGMESHKMSFTEFPNFIGESGMQIVRHNGLVWPIVEPKEGDRRWQAVAKLEEKLANASASGLSVILIVRGTPEWAQMIPGSTCGPIKSDKLDRFADFMAEAVSRYSAPPYNVKYWELGNEPDVDPLLVRPRSVFGCWGDQYDEFYGGGYYGEMLKSVYPAIKKADPDAKILIGGLLLDCDPTNPRQGKDCTPGKFLEGILANGGGDFFDMVSFHGYTPYFGPDSGFPTKLYFDEHNPDWEHRGGVIVGKVDFLREVMAGFDLEKPIFHTEGALLCSEKNPTDCDPPGESFFDAQADYAIRMYTRNWANGVSGTIWYQFDGPGWRFGGLLDENQAPKPVYQAVEFLTSQLSNAEYSGELQHYESIEGYEFISPDKRTWILWSPGERDTQILLPKDTSAVLDKFGNTLTTDGVQATVNSPIYLVLPP